LGVKRDVVLTWAKETVARNRVIKEGNADPNETDQQTYDFDAIKKALEVVTQCDRGDRDGDPRQEPRDVALAHNFLLYAHAVWTQSQAAKGHLIEKKETRDLVLANEAAGMDFKRPRCRLKSDAAEGIKRGLLLASIEGRPTLVSLKKETSGLLTTIEKLKAEQSKLTASESELSTKTARIKALETQLADESAKFASMAQSLSAAGEEKEKAAAAVAEAQKSIAAATEEYKSDMAKAKGMAESRQKALESQLERLEQTNAGTAAERDELRSLIEQKRKSLSLAESQVEALRTSSENEIRTLRAALAEATERGKSASASASASAAAKSQCEVIVKQKDAELERLRKQISDQLESMASDMASKDDAHRGEINKIQADLSRLQKLADAASARSSKVEEDARAALKSLELKAASDAADAIKCRWELSAGRKLWESQTAAAAEKLAACQENLRKATEQLEGTLETSSITMKAFINISALLKQTWYRPSSLIAAIEKELDPLF
jgi:DNA repair exonuclease SbcCD ATPase subunit